MQTRIHEFSLVLDSCHFRYLLSKTLTSISMLVAWIIIAIAHVGTSVAVGRINSQVGVCPVGDYEYDDVNFLVQWQVVHERVREKTSISKAVGNLFESPLSVRGAGRSSDVYALSDCVDAYANDLERVQPGLGQHIRNYTLNVDKTSSRKVIFAAGPGTTGTSSLASALVQMNLSVAHHIELTPNGYYRWQHSIARCWSSARMNAATCFECVRNADYASFPDEVDAAMDVPVGNVFLDLFLNFPNAKWLLNVRPSLEWAKARMKKYPQPQSMYFVEHPCFMGQSGLYSIDQMAHMLDLHNKLVKCAVPPERLFEFDLFTNGTYGLMHNLSMFLERPTTFPMNTTYPHISVDDLNSSMSL